MRHELKIPEVGESIREVQLGPWLKPEGQWADKDESLVEIESEKATVDLRAPVAGVLTKVLKKSGETAAVGEVIAYFEDAPRPASKKLPSETPSQPVGPQPPPAVSSKAAAANDRRQENGNRPHDRPPVPAKTSGDEGAQTPFVMPAAGRVLALHDVPAERIEGTGPGGRILKEDALRAVEPSPAAVAPAPPVRAEALPEAAPVAAASELRQEEIVPMSMIRRRIAQRLVEAQQQAALLTTFNEIDMSAVLALRQKYREPFQKKYNVKLGFMSFFVKAVIESLKQSPAINAEVRDNDIVYRNYYDIGIAVGGGKGLVVPVLRNAERNSFAEIELAIGDFSTRAQANKLKPDELTGGTFTISNGGVYGSLLSTPIVNPPQSGILGLHAIQDRPMARDKQVVILPMMYVALTYDHRLVDGREAVGFLRRVKEIIEDPSRMLLEI